VTTPAGGHNVRKVWALRWCPRKLISGAQTLRTAKPSPPTALDPAAERERRLDLLERCVRDVALLLIALFIVMLLTSLWLGWRAHWLDAQMDVISEARGSA